MFAQLPQQQFSQLLHDHLQEHHLVFLQSLGEEHFDLFAQVYHTRSRTLNEPIHLGSFFVKAPEQIEYDGKAVNKNLAKNDGEGFAILREVRQRLGAIEPWTGQVGYEAIEALAEEKQLKLGKVAQPLRVAVSGGTVSPPMDATLEILGKQSTLNRIDRCLTLDSSA